MSTQSEVHATSHDEFSMKRVGLWIFILSETFLFGALISTRFYLQGVERPDHLNQPLGLAISLVLLMSSLAAFRGEVAVAHNNQQKFRKNIIATIVLASIFLIGVGWEWYEAFHYFPPSSAFGTIFFTMTGIHAFHVITGIIALIVIVRMGSDGRFNSDSHWGVEGVVKYWHFVDVAWVFIYPTLYLVN